eukprot:15560483-Heterocapsa_arctica.AAC.1
MEAQMTRMQEMMIGLFQVQKNDFTTTMGSLEVKINIIDKKADDSMNEIRELKGRISTIEGNQGAPEMQ